MIPFFMAWSMFCYIPCPVHSWDDTKKQNMLVCFPIIGLMIGAINFAVYQILSLLDLRFIAAAALSFLPWMLCGFIHLDGFMDCADAVLSRRDEKRRLEILKDSHVGAFAVISIVILALMSFASWMQCIFEINPAVIILIPVVSRAVSALCIFCFKPLLVSSYAAIHSEGIKKRFIAELVIILTTVIILGLVLCGISGLVLIVTALSGFLCVVSVKSKLGGMSGDVSGCSICIAELMGVITLCFL